MAKRTLRPLRAPARRAPATADGRRRRRQLRCGPRRLPRLAARAGNLRVRVRLVPGKAAVSSCATCRLAGRRMKSFLVVGNPENRRVTAFVEAATSLAAQVRVVSWLDVIADPNLLLAGDGQPLTVRLDSWGENLEVERAFLRRGLRCAAERGAAQRLKLDEIVPATAERGRIAAPRQQHLGVLAVLADLERVLAERPTWTCAQPIAATRTLFDKRATHALCDQIAVRVPQTLESAQAPEELLSSMARAQLQRAYVK